MCWDTWNLTGYRSLCVCCSITIDADGKKSLIRLSGGDMRKALNILQVLRSCY